MAGTALSALFIRSSFSWSLGGWSPIHLLIPLTLWSLVRALVYLQRGQVSGHRRTMQWLYLNACIVTGLFTLLPGRQLGRMLWGDWLGWL